jgi:hypothetical protein
VPFTHDDIRHLSYAPETTAHDYLVSREGNLLGTVRLFSAVHLINSGQDPKAHIARRLTELGEQDGFDGVASGLANVLEMH